MKNTIKNLFDKLLVKVTFALIAISIFFGTYSWADSIPKDSPSVFVEALDALKTVADNITSVDIQFMGQDIKVTLDNINILNGEAKFTVEDNRSSQVGKMVVDWYGVKLYDLNGNLVMKSSHQIHTK